MSCQPHPVPLAPDELIDYVVECLAYSGNIGASIDTVWTWLTEKIGPLDQIQHEMIWKWLLERPDEITIASGFKSLLLDEYDDVSFHHLMSQYPDLHLYATENLQWTTLTGKPKEGNAVGGKAFELLCMISESRVNGVTNLELARRTGQDPRSFHGRTALLLDLGLIKRYPVISDSSNTYLNVYHKFIQQQEDSHVVEGHFGINVPELRKIIVTSAKQSKNGLRPIYDLKEELRFGKKPKQQRFLSIQIRKLEQQGFIQRVIVTMKASKNIKAKCIKFLKDLPEEDQGSDEFDSVDSDEFANEADESDEEAGGEDSRIEEGTGVDEETGGDEAGGDDTGVDGETDVDGQILETIINEETENKTNSPILFNTIFPLENQLLYEISKSGIDGSPVKDLCKTISGNAYVRGLSRILDDYVDMGKKNGGRRVPEHLKNLEILRGTDFDARTKYFRYFTRENYCRLVGKSRDTVWGSLGLYKESKIHSLKEINEKHRGPLPGAVNIYRESSGREFVAFHGELASMGDAIQVTESSPIPQSNGQKKRGRPRKESGEVAMATGVKRGRGRPRKMMKVEETGGQKDETEGQIMGDAGGETENMEIQSGEMGEESEEEKGQRQDKAMETEMGQEDQQKEAQINEQSNGEATESISISNDIDINDIDMISESNTVDIELVDSSNKPKSKKSTTNQHRIEEQTKEKRSLAFEMNNTDSEKALLTHYLSNTSSYNKRIKEQVPEMSKQSSTITDENVNIGQNVEENIKYNNGRITARNNGQNVEQIINFGDEPNVDQSTDQNIAPNIEQMINHNNRPAVEQSPDHNNGRDVDRNTDVIQIPLATAKREALMIKALTMKGGVYEGGNALIRLLKETNGENLDRRTMLRTIEGMLETGKVNKTFYQIPGEKPTSIPRYYLSLPEIPVDSPLIEQCKKRLRDSVEQRNSNFSAVTNTLTKVESDFQYYFLTDKNKKLDRAIKRLSKPLESSKSPRKSAITGDFLNDISTTNGSRQKGGKKSGQRIKMESNERNDPIIRKRSNNRSQEEQELFYRTVIISRSIYYNSPGIIQWDKISESWSKHVEKTTPISCKLRWTRVRDLNGGGKMIDSAIKRWEIQFLTSYERGEIPKIENEKDFDLVELAKFWKSKEKQLINTSMFDLYENIEDNLKEYKFNEHQIREDVFESTQNSSSMIRTEEILTNYPFGFGSRALDERQAGKSSTERTKLSSEPRESSIKSRLPAIQTGKTSIGPRESAIHAGKVAESSVQASPSSIELQLTEQSIKGIIATNSEGYDAEKAKEILAEKGENLCEKAIDHLLKQRTIIYIPRDREKVMPGRNFMFTDKFQSYLQLKFGNNVYEATSGFESELIGILSANESFNLPRAASDNQLICILELICYLNIELNRKELTNDALATNISRHMDKEKLDIDIDIVKGGDLEQMKRPAVKIPGKGQNATFTWIDINGNVSKDIWKKLVFVLLWNIAMRPGISKGCLMNRWSILLTEMELNALLGYLVERRCIQLGEEESYFGENRWYSHVFEEEEEEEEG